MDTGGIPGVRIRSYTLLVTAGGSAGLTASPWWRQAVWSGGSVIAPALLALLWVPFRTSHSNVVVALAMILVTTAAGAALGRAAVVGAAFSAAVTFTYFDTAPFDRFTIAKQADIATAVSLVVVGLLTGEVALRMARARRTAASTTRLLGRVRDAAGRLARGEELVVVVDAVAAELTSLLGVTRCEFSAEPLPEGAAVIDRSGAVSPKNGLTYREVALPVWALGDVVGHFLLGPVVPTPPPERLQVAMTLADQVGAALAAQGPLPPLDPTSHRADPRTPALVPQLRVVRDPSSSSAEAGGPVPFEGFEELPEGVQHRKPSPVRTDDALHDQLRPGNDAGHLAPAEKDDGERAGAVDERALERRHSRPRVDADGAHPTGDSDPRAVHHLVDGRRPRHRVEPWFATITSLFSHRRAS